MAICGPQYIYAYKLCLNVEIIELMRYYEIKVYFFSFARNISNLFYFFIN